MRAAGDPVVSKAMGNGRAMASEALMTAVGDRAVDIGDRGFRGNDRDRFGGHSHDWWRHNHQHHYWNGNRWVYGVEPAGFVYVPVPTQYCPFTVNSFNGDPYNCYQTCVNNGYDPMVCENCCGVNY